MPVEYQHLLLFGWFMIVGWFVYIYFWPRIVLYVYKRAILARRFGESPIPIDTLYT